MTRLKTFFSKFLGVLIVLGLLGYLSIGVLYVIKIIDITIAQKFGYPLFLVLITLIIIEKIISKKPKKRISQDKILIVSNILASFISAILILIFILPNFSILSNWYLLFMCFLIILFFIIFYIDKKGWTSKYKKEIFRDLVLNILIGFLTSIAIDRMLGNDFVQKQLIIYAIALILYLIYRKL